MKKEKICCVICSKSIYLEVFMKYKKIYFSFIFSKYIFVFKTNSLCIKSNEINIGNRFVSCYVYYFADEVLGIKGHNSKLLFKAGLTSHDFEFVTACEYPPPPRRQRCKDMCSVRL